MKFIQHSPLICADREADLLFTRVIKKNQREFKGLTYEDMIDALQIMADNKYPNLEEFQTFHGAEARFLKLVDKCLLASKASKKAIKVLKKESAKQRLIIVILIVFLFSIFFQISFSSLFAATRYLKFSCIKNFSNESNKIL